MHHSLEYQGFVCLFFYRDKKATKETKKRQKKRQVFFRRSKKTAFLYNANFFSDIGDKSDKTYLSLENQRFICLFFF
jgi:hypothetical protein